MKGNPNLVDNISPSVMRELERILSSSELTRNQRVTNVNNLLEGHLTPQEITDIFHNNESPLTLFIRNNQLSSFDFTTTLENSPLTPYRFTFHSSNLNSLNGDRAQSLSFGYDYVREPFFTSLQDG